jgi:outer membrane lipoprotein carrier protein
MTLQMKVATLACTLLLAVSAHAAEIDRAAANLPGSEASFTQQFTPKGFKTSQSESGTVIFGTLPQMRWSYSSPEQKLFVFDGARSWFYIPADKQVTVADLDSERRAELPFLIIGDPAARDRAFVVKESTRGNTVTATLQPKSGAAMIRNVVVSIDASTHSIRSVSYTDREGNQTTFAFSGFHKRATPADLFHFNVPAGVQVVQQ